MRAKPKGYELNEYTAEQAEKDNIEWFSSLSPGNKIRAIEEEIRTLQYLKSLKKVPRQP